MNSNTVNENIKKIASFNGIEVYYIKALKFTTNLISINFFDNLNRVNVTKNALLPSVLKRGSKRYPTIAEMSLYLEDLYGAAFEAGVSKKGEYQQISFNIDYVKKEYTITDDELFDKVLDFIYDIIFNPLLENDGFNEEYLKVEKVNLAEKIKSRINDKTNYAIERCYEIMCKGEPFEIYEDGYEEDLDKIEAKELYDYYKNIFLKTLPVKIYISGDESAEKIDEFVKRLSKVERSNVIELKSEKINKENIKINEFTEKMKVNQAKLTLGFRTNIYPEDDDYYKLMVYNGILGGGLHSKLFANVREKEGLAYYIFSRIERLKAIQIISGGIDSDKKDKTLKIVMEQIEDIKNGKISDYEFDSTIKAIETSLNYRKDSMFGLIGFYMNQLLSGTDVSIEEIINRVKMVTVEDVIGISKKIYLDTVYLLEGE